MSPKSSPSFIFKEPSPQSNDVLHQLKVLHKALDANIVDLNSGGCCVAASRIARRLEAMGVEVLGCRVISSRYDLPDDPKERAVTNIGNIRARIFDPGDTLAWNANHIHFGHVKTHFVYNGQSYDFCTYEGLVDLSLTSPTLLKPWRVDVGLLTIDEAWALADRGRWNDEFDRGQIPLMEKIINRHLPAPCPGIPTFDHFARVYV